MKSLLIETSTEQSGIALALDGRVVLQRLFSTGLSSSRALMPELVASFAELSWSASDVAYIGVGVGPGSYTGMRVGAMVAKALAYALSCPLVTFTSLEAFCLRESDLPYAVLFDAKIAGTYVQLFGRQRGPEVIGLKNLELYLEGIDRVVSPHKEKLLQRVTLNKEWAEAVLNFTRLSKQCEENFRAGRGCSGDQLELLYLRGGPTQVV